VLVEQRLVVQQRGVGVLGVLAVPALVALVPLVMRSRRAAMVTAAVLTVAALVASASVGIFFIRRSFWLGSRWERHRDDDFRGVSLQTALVVRKSSEVALDDVGRARGAVFVAVIGPEGRCPLLEVRLGQHPVQGGCEFAVPLGPRDGRTDPERLDAGSRVGLIEAPRDRHVGYACPDGCDGSADAGMVDGAQAAGHHGAEGCVFSDVHAVEPRQVVVGLAGTGHDQHPSTRIEDDACGVVEEVVGVDGAVGSQRHEQGCVACVEEGQGRRVDGSLGGGIPGDK
jgi:hypothetical protein